MNLEETIRLWIYIHAALGGIALIAGMMALIFKKGMKAHKNSGSVFYYSMLGSALIALVVSLAPGHDNAFLFAIGVFSLYSLVGGKRSLKFRTGNFNPIFDKLLAVVMLFVGFLMIGAGFFLYENVTVVLIVFGILGLQGSISDLILFRNTTKMKVKWLTLHIGKMTGGYIACFSAFLVVNNAFPTYVNWFGPGIIGSVYITYWIRKVKRTSKVITT